MALGKDIFRSLTVNSTAQAIQSNSGQITGFNIINRHTADIYVKLYNKAAGSVNAASDTPVLTLLVPASGAVHSGITRWDFDTAVSIRAVTGSGDTDTTAPGTLPIIEILHGNF